MKKIISATYNLRFVADYFISAAKALEFTGTILRDGGFLRGRAAILPLNCRSANLLRASISKQKTPRFCLRLFIRFIILVVVLFSTSISAWTSTGHRLVAQIAYQRLNPHAKEIVNHLTQSMFYAHSARKRFFSAAVWPDKLRYDDITAFNYWHFINLPYSIDNTPTLPINPENVAWAVNQSVQVVSSAKANTVEKAVFLSALVHFVADAHQPLHCINRYSRLLPQGDQGGNLIPIKSQYANNLHAYWDQGAGLFHAPGKRYSLRYQEVIKLAQQISDEYPPSYFKSKVNDTNPYHWTRESFNIAKDFAYRISPNSTPTQSYATMVQEIVKRRIALAAYRLANLLNEIYK